MNTEQLLELHEQLSTRGREIMRAKNTDYTAQTKEHADALSNFKGSLVLGVEPEMGLLLRVQDKMKRVQSFVQNGELAVKDEGWQDAALDMMNYAVLLYGLLQERAEKMQPKVISDTELERIIRDAGVQKVVIQEPEVKPDYCCAAKDCFEKGVHVDGDRAYCDAHATVFDV